MVASIARRLGYQIEGFFDDGLTRGAQVLGVPVLGPLSEATSLPQDCWLFVSIGDNRRRAEVFRELSGRRLATLIDPHAIIDETVVVGEGTVIMPGVVVNVDTRIGRNCILNTSCSVDHDGLLEDHAHICPGAHLAGTVRVGEGAMIGTGVSVIPGIQIGAHTVVGAGAAVVRNLPAGVRAMGVPARVVG